MAIEKEIKEKLEDINLRMGYMIFMIFIVGVILAFAINFKIPQKNQNETIYCASNIIYENGLIILKDCSDNEQENSVMVIIE